MLSIVSPDLFFHLQFLLFFAMLLLPSTGKGHIQTTRKKIWWTPLIVPNVSSLPPPPRTLRWSMRESSELKIFWITTTSVVENQLSKISGILCTQYQFVNSRNFDSLIFQKLASYPLNKDWFLMSFLLSSWSWIFTSIWPGGSSCHSIWNFLYPRERFQFI